MFVELFVHGPLTDADKRYEVFGRPVPYMAPDTASGFREDSPVDGVDYPLLVTEPSSMVHGGTVIIHQDELRLLEEYGLRSHLPREVVLMSSKRAWAMLRR